MLSIKGFSLQKLGAVKDCLLSNIGLELSYSIIEDLALGKEVPSRFKDKVYDSLYSAICEFLNSHPRFFDGLARDRVEGSSVHEAFKQVAHELFDVRVF